MKALINIDYTYDFVANDGKLTCGKNAQDIEQNIVDKTNEFINNGDLVIFAIDLHYENDNMHPETKLFPPHNINNTGGRKLYNKLNKVYSENIDNPNVIWIDKTRYSAFAGTNLQYILNERNIKEIHLVGVCTDICVLHTAIEAYNLTYDVYVHENCVTSFDLDNHNFALGHLKNVLNVKII